MQNFWWNLQDLSNHPISCATPRPPRKVCCDRKQIRILIWKKESLDQEQWQHYSKTIGGCLGILNFITNTNTKQDHHRIKNDGCAILRPPRALLPWSASSECLAASLYLGKYKYEQRRNTNTSNGKIQIRTIGKYKCDYWINTNTNNGKIQIPAKNTIKAPWSLQIIAREKYKYEQWKHTMGKYKYRRNLSVAVT